jgi:hypothetical protein
MSIQPLGKAGKYTLTGQLRHRIVTAIGVLDARYSGGWKVMRIRILFLWAFRTIAVSRGEVGRAQILEERRR